MQKRILLVDDEPSIRQSLSKILRAEDYEVLLAEDGPEASKQYGAQRVDVLIFDLNLPVKAGCATLEWLTKINPLLPIVIITGHSDQSALQQIAGANALMEKPLNVPLLLKTIREWMEEPMEIRAARASRRGYGNRYLPSDHEQFREMKLDRFVSNP